MDDSSSQNSVGAALNWIAGLLSGSLAVAVAMIAVAGVGILALQGRLDLRRASFVILGCFVIFGASGIAAGIASVLGPQGGADAAGMPAAASPPAPAAPAAVAAQPYDPYAGAALPQR